MEIRECKYDVENGKLKFFYNDMQISLDEFVPERIVKLGEKEIKKYVDARITKRKKVKDLEHRKLRKKIASTNFQIKLKHDGKIIQGRVIDYKGDNDRGVITVILEKPKKYQGKEDIFTCLGLGLSGFRFFDDKGNLTDGAIEMAEKSIIVIYKENRKKYSNKKAYRMAHSLNAED